MITKVNDNELRTLALFTNGYDKDYYIREVAAILKISSRTALLTLQKLEKKQILRAKTRGKIKTYSIQLNQISKEYFILTEQYKKIKFLQKHLKIKEIVEKSFTDGMAVIFGSYAKGLEHKESDLDIFLIGNYSKELKKFGKVYGLDISIKRYPFEYLERGDDILWEEVMKSHIVIQNLEEFVNRVLKWIPYSGAWKQGKEFN